MRVGLPVEQQPRHAVRVRADGEGPQRDVGGDPVPAQLDGDVVQERVLGRPGVRVVEPDPCRPAGRHLVLAARRPAPRHPAGRVHGDLDGPVREVRHQGQPLDVHGGHRLEPDGLPDPGLRGVPDAAAVQPLLARRVLGPVAPVAYVDHELVVARSQRGGQVARERQVAAHVGADLDAVEPHGAGLVDGAEVQQHPVVDGAEPVRQPQRPAVAEPLVGLQLPAHPGQRRLRAERDDDAPVVPRGRRLGGRRDGVVPPAVEVEVAVPDQLRARVLRQHGEGIEETAPPGGQVAAHPPSIPELSGGGVVRAT